MYLSDTITTEHGVPKVGVNALYDACIFNWAQAKKALAEGRLRKIRGVGRKTAAAIRYARPST